VVRKIIRELVLVALLDAESSTLIFFCINAGVAARLQIFEAQLL
jgi:hypothetical protein